MIFIWIMILMWFGFSLAMLCGSDTLDDYIDTVEGFIVNYKTLTLEMVLIGILTLPFLMMILPAMGLISFILTPKNIQKLLDFKIFK